MTFEPIGTDHLAPVAPYATEEHERSIAPELLSRSIAAAVAEIDELHAENKRLTAENERLRSRADDANADYRDLLAVNGRDPDVEVLRRENAVLKAELARAGRPDNPLAGLVALITSPAAKAIGGQILKAVTSSARPDSPVADRRAGSVEAPPLPARHPHSSRPAPVLTHAASGDGTPRQPGAGHPDSAPEVEHPVGQGPDSAPSGAGQEEA